MTSRVKATPNRVAAMIMGVVAIVSGVGAVVFGVAHMQETSRRSDLRSVGVEVPVVRVDFVEQDVRRLNPNTGRYDDYSDDQIEFVFDASGESYTATQPISRDDFVALRNRSDLTAVYDPADLDGAELLADGEFVAAARPYWLIALIASAMCLWSVWSVMRSIRPRTPTQPQNSDLSDPPGPSAQR